jgi:hypothetical protein
MQQMKSQRCVLSVSQAREIFGLKSLASTSALAPGAQGQLEEISICVLLAAKYKVSSKTIRDIWNRKTWVCATEQLFDQQQVSPIDSTRMDCLDVQVRIVKKAFVYPGTLGLTIRLQNGHQLRPSKVGRPKGSRNKRPRARKMDKLPVSHDSSDTTINAHHSVSSRCVDDQAHPTNVAQSLDLGTADCSGTVSRIGVASARWHYVGPRLHHTQIANLIPTHKSAFPAPIALGAPSFEVHGTHRPNATSDRCHPTCRNCHAYEQIASLSQSPVRAMPAPIAFDAPSIQPLDAHLSYNVPSTAVVSGGARPFEPPDAYHRCAPDSASPAHFAPGFTDPFHFDWPHW